MPETATAIVWFRQDLRLADNPALHAAARSGAEILPIFIHDDEEAGDWRPGSASRWWLRKSIASLNESLHGHLRVYRGNAREIIPRLVRDTGAEAVYWNRCVEPWRVTRDQSIKEQLLVQGTPVHTFNGSYLYEPAEVAKADGTPYRVFTPFYRRGCKALQPRQPLPVPPNLRLDSDSHPDGHDERPILPAFPWFEDDEQRWQPGEKGAHATLATFLSSGLDIYVEARDRPDLGGVSRLSPHLHFGEISPHQVRKAILGHVGDEENESADKFLSELGWREFSAHLLYHWPELTDDNLQKKFDRFPWEDDEDLQQAWQEGATGYPIVDAGMRQLWRTGYMHNRVRMITASFLVKNLLQDWRAGARWFWNSLLDADLANNSASWQWVAGCGADAAPYFRIFNPVTQGRKFDPGGNYVKQYVPELARLPDRFVHCPWEAPDHVLESAGLRLGRDYPRPIVDLAKSRERALDAFAALGQPAGRVRQAS
jgi:deoxyribodipyrimidine photo-lyase